MLKKEHIGFRIKRASVLIGRKLENKLKNGTCNHGYIIGYIFSRKDQDTFQKDIEKEFSIRRSTATGIIKSMENKGLIKKEMVLSDARLKKIVLTKKAIDKQKEIERNLCNFDKSLKKYISKEEIENFFNVLDKIETNISNI